jgi:hypothetical protein
VTHAPVRRSQRDEGDDGQPDGLAIALGSAVAAEQWDADEGVTTLGVEVGAALWFAGAVAWSVRSNTVRHELLVLVGALVGLALVTVSLTAG